MSRTFAALTASAALVACGLAHGVLTDRWSGSDAPAEAAARYPLLPQRLGEWDGQDIEVKGRPDPALAGSLQRRYVHRGSGREVTLALFCGKPEPVATHSPDVCYGASGYSLGPVTRVAVDGGQMWTTDAEKRRAGGVSRLRLYWAWSAGAGWSASDRPRLDFSRRPVLHKLYLIREIEEGEGELKEEPCLAFLKELLPALQRDLFDAR
jgi:hypothetical protein